MKKTNLKTNNYRGRFAPSPTGELHFGSLLAAMASYADAKKNNGQWLLRIDDIDQARVIDQSDLHILNTLEQCGFKWDESVTYQSQCLSHYQSALEQLEHSGLSYACSCSRKQIQAIIEKNHLPPGIYPGTCRNQSIIADNYATRIQVADTPIDFNDLIQGHCSSILSKDSGDFIILRRDKTFSYQLSVVVDDFRSQITHVVRGADLLDSTARQIYLQQQLAYPTPHYAHIPLAVSAEKLKLSKLSQAKKIRCDLKTLTLAADFLGQQPINHHDLESKADFWQYLLNIWDINRVPKMEKQMLLV